MERGWKESGTEKAGSRERMWVVERGEAGSGEAGRGERRRVAERGGG